MVDEIKILDTRKLINEKHKHYLTILEARKNIAELKQNKAVEKAPLWEEATGTVDAKKDYIKSKLSMVDMKIRENEAIIEYSYNMIDILNDKLVYCYE